MGLARRACFVAWWLGLAIGASACGVGAGPRPGAGPGPGLERAPPPVFVEGRRTARPELFGALRKLGVELWIDSDRLLGVRLHDAAVFEVACELLGELDHDLRVLDLAYLDIDDLGPLMYVRNTASLNLSGTRADLRAVRHLTRLEELALNHTDFRSLALLGELRGLRRLELAGARANLIGIGQLSELRELDLSAARTAPQGFELRDGDGLDLDALHDLSLEVLGLRRTKVQDWAPLADLWTLRRLDLSYTNFADLRLLADFTELEVLGLRRTAVHDLTPLMGLSSLRNLDLRDCELVDDAQIQAFRTVRPEVALEL